MMLVVEKEYVLILLPAYECEREPEVEKRRKEIVGMIYNSCPRCADFDLYLAVLCWDEYIPSFLCETGSLLLRVY